MDCNVKRTSLSGLGRSLCYRMPRAFRWTATGGMEDIGTGPGRYYSIAHGVSADGSVVVGEVFDTNFVLHAFRWTSATGMQYLPPVPPALGDSDVARAVSADGSVIVGESEYDEGDFHAFRWTAATGTVDLAFLTLDAWLMYARSVSADGSKIAGESYMGPARAFVWNWPAPSGQQLTLIDSTWASSGNIGYAISADGSVVAGKAYLDSGIRAFRWTEASGMMDLGTLPGDNNSMATAVSANGTAVVGWSSSLETGMFHAFLWRACDQLSCVSIDFNNDTSFFDPQDIDAFLSIYSEGPCIPDTAFCDDIDFNNDTSLFDPCDIDSFLRVFSEGPCTLCGV